VPSIVRPSRLFSFGDWSKYRSRDPLPGDRLDAQIQNLIEAIASTQKALEDIRRDDGRLKNQSVHAEQLSDGLAQQLAGSIAAHTANMVQRAEQSAARAQFAEENLALYAKDAEAAAISASQFLSAVNVAKELVDQKTHSVINAADVVDAESDEAEDWANYSKACADNAIAAKDEALQWAEYLAGPVVGEDDAPEYIANSNFPHGLFYQPVEGYGGSGGLWSAKWWAIYAAQLVGPWGFYYLGGWSSAPAPGATNPDTGVKVPDPLAPGSIYYDTTTGQLYTWDGGQWKTPLTLASGFKSQYVYKATANQTDFSGADISGHTPVVGTSPSDVHVNGVRMVLDDGSGTLGDYTINTSTNVLHFLEPLLANSIVQWDLLVPPSKLVPGSVWAFGVTLTPGRTDGTNKIFTMQYMNPNTSNLTPVNVTTDGSQLQVSLDGIVQQPGVDYTASGNTLTMNVAPVAGARFWVVWFANETLT
jgi:hypothetical protein